MTPEQEAHLKKIIELKEYFIAQYHTGRSMVKVYDEYYRGLHVSNLPKRDLSNISINFANHPR